jgi:hypothetical protein
MMEDDDEVVVVVVVWASTLRHSDNAPKCHALLHPILRRSISQKG